MSRQDLSGVIITVILVSTWTILKVDALAKVHVDKVCQESLLYHNIDRNPRSVDLATLKVCIKRWDERLRRAPNDYTIRLQHNRMQTFLRNSMAVDKFQVPMSPQQVDHHVGKFYRIQNPQKCKKLAEAPIPAGDKKLQELNGQLVQCMNRLKSSKKREHDAAESARLQAEIDLLLERFNQLEQARINRKIGGGGQGGQSKAKSHKRTQATFSEVWQELVKIYPHSSTRIKAEPSHCIDLVNTLLATPNPPFLTGINAKTHTITVQDCAKVWEKLRDKAADDLNKQTLLQRELKLMKDRLVQIKVETKRRSAQGRKDDKTVIRNCEHLLRNPRNLAVATMEQKLKYQAELEACIEKWGQLKERQRIGLNGELFTMRNELTRVKDLIRGVGQQNAAAGPSGVQAKVMRPKVVPPKKPLPWFRQNKPGPSMAKKSPESHRHRGKEETDK